MPFTFAHPALVLPLHYCSRRFVSLSGLVAGSMAPDFEYFLRMRVESRYSHSLWGMIWFDLPVSLILLFLFHSIVRNPLLAALPLVLRRRLQVYRLFSWNKRFQQAWPVVFTSILIGTASHLLWDSFTHEHGFFVDHLRVLQSERPGVPVYKLLQHGSTILGLVVIGCSVWQLPAHATVTTCRYPGRFWLIAAIATALTLIVRVSCAEGRIGGGHLVVSFISAGMIGLMAAAVGTPKEKGTTFR